MKHRTCRPFLTTDLFLKLHQSQEEGLRPGRAAGHIDIHRQDLINTLDHTVHIIHAAGIRAAAHGDNPAGLGHLFIKTQHRRCHLLENRTRYHHQVGLARGAAQDFGAEAGDIVPGSKRGHHFNETAGQAEEHRPEGIGPPPVDEIIQTGQEDIGMCDGFLFGHRISVRGSRFEVKGSRFEDRGSRIS